MSAIIYLNIDEVKAIHEAQIARFGGAPGIRDEGLIEAALARPQNGYYSDIVEQAAALWESLTMNHGFVDGNKRIGFAAALVFLRMNKVKPSISRNEAADFVLGALEDGTFDKEKIEDWLHLRIAK